MKLVTFTSNGTKRAGVLVNNQIVDISLAFPEFPSSILALLEMGKGAMANLSAKVAALEGTSIESPLLAPSDATLCSPIPRPTSMRDGYAFRQHVESARRNRGLDMIPEFDEIPIFYFTNHQAVYGPGDIPVRELHCDKLDFELECAIVIGTEGRNISASEADNFIAGYMVMNDWSARELQMQEMKLNLGPAKGKDFATSLGPWLVTPDELEKFKVPSQTGGPGNAYNLVMTTTVNGSEVSRGNVRDMSWTFAQIIERASYGVTLYPGDVIGSGTCGTGCFLELNGSKVFPEPWWLKPGDVVECTIDQLGTLSNTIVSEQL